MTVFTNRGGGKDGLPFAAPYPGRSWRSICARSRPVDLPEGSFVCAARGVSVGIAFQKKIGVGLFAARGSSCRSWKGTDWSSSTPADDPHHGPRPRQTLRVDTGCLVALTPTVNYDIQSSAR